MRPQNTRAAYLPKEAAFQALYQAKQYHNYNTITEDKVLLYLMERVADRPLQAKSHRLSLKATGEEASQLL